MQPLPEIRVAGKKRKAFLHIMALNEYWMFKCIPNENHPKKSPVKKESSFSLMP
jgi:hypothetical protein